MGCGSLSLRGTTTLVSRYHTDGTLGRCGILSRYCLDIYLTPPFAPLTCHKALYSVPALRRAYVGINKLRRGPARAVAGGSHCRRRGVPCKVTEFLTLFGMGST